MLAVASGIVRGTMPTASMTDELATEKERTVSANEQMDHLTANNQRRPWTPATEELRVRCRPFRDQGFGDLGIEGKLREGKDRAPESKLPGSIEECHKQIETLTNDLNTLQN
ncbi:unnamed protein product [Spodoptera exigua]|nr:unnamed protein product [Spodoptera exigua]